MSKVSISRDRWRQLGQSNYADWCPGCGLYAYANGAHRADCTLGQHHQRGAPCPTA